MRLDPLVYAITFTDVDTSFAWCVRIIAREQINARPLGFITRERFGQLGARSHEQMARPVHNFASDDARRDALNEEQPNRLPVSSHNALLRNSV
jgi:hypothetical protein